MSFTVVDPSTSIPGFYSGRSIFVTGATGFMGKVLLEKLLRSCPDVREIFLLMRPKKGISIDDRLRRMLTNKVSNTFMYALFEDCLCSGIFITELLSIYYTYSFTPMNWKKFGWMKRVIYEHTYKRIGIQIRVKQLYAIYYTFNCKNQQLIINCFYYPHKNCFLQFTFYVHNSKIFINDLSCEDVYFCNFTELIE